MLQEIPENKSEFVSPEGGQRIELQPPIDLGLDRREQVAVESKESAKESLSPEEFDEPQLVGHSSAGEPVLDASNYNAEGLQGPLINESTEQIKARLQEYLNSHEDITADAVDITEQVLGHSQIE